MPGGSPPAVAIASMRIRDRALVCERQCAEKHERRRHVQRRRQRSCFDGGALSIGVRKIQPVIETDLVAGADARIKIREIRAAAESYVLAVVHFAAIRQRVGSGAPAQVRTLLQKADAQARFSQRDGGGQSRQAAADHQNALRGHHPSLGRLCRRKPAVRRYWIFSALESETRGPNTSNPRSSILREQAAVGANQRPESGAAIRIHLCDQRRALAIHSPGAIRFEFEQLLQLFCYGPAQFLRAHGEAVQIFLRQVNAPHRVVAADIANDVGQLKREAQTFGEIGRFGIR